MRKMSALVTALVLGTIAPKALPGTEAAQVEAGATFTRITGGPVVTDGGISWAGAWVDYDGDGWLDLFVTNGDYSGNGRNFLYHNNGDGTFTRVADSVLEKDSGSFRGCAWVDWNNDGYPDVSAVTFGSGNRLYQNNGDGTFTKVTGNAITSDAIRASIVGSWSDYNRDGYLDYVVGNSGDRNFLYRNNGSGGFIKVTQGSIATDYADTEAAAWGDFDNDGWPDLFMTNFEGIQNFLYRNQGGGSFARLSGATAGSLVTDSINSGACAVGDYDNDGYLDIYIPSLGVPEQPGALYHNNGDGTFKRVTTGSIAMDVTRGSGCAWADYDNDGYLDLFVARIGLKHLLYHNNGDGTFTRIDTGALVESGGTGVQSFSAVFGDFNNDGFPDLFLAQGGGGQAAFGSQDNALFRNNGNANGWIKIRCVGTASNRSGVGAKVRINAIIGGKAQWQMREISHGSELSSSPLEADFGLGDATNVIAIRIEWPSGTVQTVENVAARQSLVLTEPVQLGIDSSGQVSVPSWRGQRFHVETSTNLANWSVSLSITNISGDLKFTAMPSSERVKFFRLVAE